MVIRQISARLYLIAATLVLLVLLTGSFLARFLNGRRADWVEGQWIHQQAEWLRLQVRYSELLDHPSSDNCVATRLALLNSVESINTVQRKLDKYLSSSFGQSRQRLSELKRGHTMSALQHWSLSIKLWKICSAPSAPVLYLYSGKTCPECFFQTQILLFMQHRYRSKLLVFPVDLDFVPAADFENLKKVYALMTLPTFIIGETKYEGFLSKEKLQAIIAVDHETAREGLVTPWIPRLSTLEGSTPPTRELFRHF